MKRLEKIFEPDFKSLFLGDTKWIDVRAPIEFGAGSLPGAINLPLLTDSERHDVGLIYKQKGQEAAIELGHRLVSGEVRESRVEAWLSELEQHPGAILFCFRGGLRSQLTQQWLHERGVDRPIVSGGYKALRRYLQTALETCAGQQELLVVTGPTGSGKTEYLGTCGRPYLDLEALASHRGSAFGALGQQPSQVDFENALAIELIRLQKIEGPVLIEDESRRIGQRSIPEALFQKMKSSPKLKIEVSFENRVENIFTDYVLKSSLGASGDLGKFDDFRRSVMAISRKLGGLRAQEIMADLAVSQIEFEAGRGLDTNRVWIDKLLKWYYDPLYSGSR